MPVDRPVKVNVASGARPTAETIRTLIDSALAVLRKDAADTTDGFLVKELFSFWGEEVQDQVRQFLLLHENIPVKLHWPREALNIVQINVVSDFEKEDVQRSYLGDVSGQAAFGRYIERDPETGEPTEIDASGPITFRQQFGMGTTCSTSVFVRAKDPLDCVYLTHIVRLIIFMNKMPLIESADMHNLTIDIEEIAHNPELFPEFAYTRRVALSYASNFDYNLPEEVFQLLNFDILVNPGPKVGVPVNDPVNAVKVPYDE